MLLSPTRLSQVILRLKIGIVLEHLGDTRLPVQAVLLGDFNAKHSEWFVGDSTNYHEY